MNTGVPLQRSCEQPSNVWSVYKCFYELSELVHQSLYIVHSPGRPLTSWDLLGIYTQHLDWYDRILVVLRLGCNFHRLYFRAVGFRVFGGGRSVGQRGSRDS